MKLSSFKNKNISLNNKILTNTTKNFTLTEKIVIKNNNSTNKVKKSNKTNISNSTGKYSK